MFKCGYEAWHKSVGAFIAALTGGLSMIDLEDYPFRADWDNLVSPRKSAEKAIASLRYKEEDMTDGII